MKLKPSSRERGRLFAENMHCAAGCDSGARVRVRASTCSPTFLLDTPTSPELIPDPASRIFFNRMPIRPDISASPAARLADELRLQIGQPDVIGPSVAADRRPMAAVIVGAIDQQAANAGGSHLSEANFLLARFYGAAAGEGGHAPLKLGLQLSANRPICWNGNPIVKKATPSGSKCRVPAAPVTGPLKSP